MNQALDRAEILSDAPPPEALRWVEHVTHSRVLTAKALTGGMSSAVHLVTLEVGGARRELVLRRYVRRDVTLEEPDIAEREVRTLQLIQSLALSTPAVVASDVSGRDVGVPAILMTVVPGTTDAIDPGVPAWRQIAEATETIHRAPIGLADGVQPFYGYPPRRDVPPPWMADPQVWERAVGIFRAGTSGDDQRRVFLHRDLHLGNMLWRSGRLAGIVDWQAASIGPASTDVGNMRFDVLERYGPAAAAAFLRVAEEVSGRPHDPWADVILLVDRLGTARDEPPRHHEAFEATLACALSELGAR